jgi:MOSC domain-containing protein YiiM
MLRAMTLDDLERRFRAAPAPPSDAGTVRMIVVRRSGGVHELPAQARLDPALGIDGDRWASGATPDPGSQVTMIEQRVTDALAPDTPSDRAGDNLVVDLELSETSLPAGTRLRVGTAVLEVSTSPHHGCAKFRERFGADALRWVNLPEHRDKRLRGLKARVLVAGVVAVGDHIVRLG